jgi:glycosyltransferase involved in cell wall biosynthesis
MSIILSHPTGNANLRAVADGLVAVHELEAFYTTIAAIPKSFLWKLSKIGPLAELRRREYDTSLAPYLKLFPQYEIGRMIANKAGFKKWNAHEKGVFSVDNVYRTLDQHVAKGLKSAKQHGVKAVYSYEDGALASFRKAKQLGLNCLYDLPIGYWRAMRRLLESEKEAHPQWAATLTGFQDSPEKLTRKDEELRLADQIFVASSFTAATLKDYPGTLAPITVIPYGFPTPVTNRIYQSLHNRPLKILFVGGLSQRKGIANLFDAVGAFGKRVELTIVGNKAVPDCEALNTALTKHKWIPSLPHAEILQLMQQQDVFIFPSLFEGFGLVITEAMSQGTPVITTERTAGPDIITNDENGWIVAAGNTEALKSAIENILVKPDLLKQAGRLSIETAKQRPWSAYGTELANKIRSVI